MNCQSGKQEMVSEASIYLYKLPTQFPCFHQIIIKQYEKQWSIEARMGIRINYFFS